ncbi:hypothetical protein BDZ89DRAFT_1084104 [Hymenopellis radicata]|nr:hypothetical protein BDZ89DRAFT_1084104 [Hymenopellis radicata]
MATKCALCSTPYKDPSSIPCGHIFCFPCLQSHIAQTSQDGYDAKCPTCQRDFPFCSSLRPPCDVNLVMKPLQKHLHSGIRRVHIDIDTKEKDTLALDLAEARTALAELQDTLADSQSVPAARDAALEDAATQLENQARKADDLQTKLNVEKEVTERQKRELEGLRANQIDVANQLQNQMQKADDLQAKLNFEKEVTEKQRRELEALRSQKVNVESSNGVPIPTASVKILRPARPCPDPISASGHAGPEKRPRTDSGRGRGRAVAMRPMPQILAHPKK